MFQLYVDKGHLLRLLVGSGVKLLGPLTTTPGALANGMIWTGADGKMRCYTNGTTRLLGVGAT